MVTTEKGHIVQRFELKQGNRRDGSKWQRQDILFEIKTSDVTIKRIVLSADEMVISQIDSYPKGSELVVDFEVIAREWQGKWFNNINITDIQMVESKQTPEPKAEETLDPQEGDLPF